MGWTFIPFEKEINFLIKNKTLIYKWSNFKPWSEQKSTHTHTHRYTCACTHSVIIVLEWHCLATDVTPKTLMTQYMS